MVHERHLKRVIAALDIISSRLNQNNIPWLLGASGALMVNGVKIIPHDLDIFVSKENVVKIEKLLGKYLKNPVHEYIGETGTYLECQLEIEGVEVEILELGDLGNPRPVDFHGQTVYVNTLRNELEFYKKRANKQDVVKLIEETINNNSQSTENKE